MAGSTVRVDGEVTIGRDGRPGGVSFEADEEMSRRHAEFRRLASGAVLLEDIGSSNGTFVNDERIDIPRLLAIGDEIRIGLSVMVLEQLPEAEAPTLAAVAGTSGTTLLTPPAASDSPPAPLPVTDVTTLPPPRAMISLTDATTLPPPRATISLTDVTTLPAPPPGPLGGPTAGGSGGPGGQGNSARRGWRGVVVLVAALLVALVVGFVAGRSGHSGAAAPPDVANGIGTVYLESGAAQPNANAVLAFYYQAGGDLHPLDIRAYPTGGAAGFDLTNTGALDADGQLATSADHRLLFAVNQGSDTVAVFHIRSDGSLLAVAGSPFPSNGVAPGGLAVSGDRLVVVNKAQDGVRDLRSVSPNVTSFVVEPDGSLRPTGSVITLPAGSSPTEALISPDGRIVVVPEEHGPFVSLTLGTEGQLSPAPGSPYGLPSAIFPAGYPETERWALGLSAQPGGGVLYGQAVDTGELVTYRYDDSGRLSFVGATADPGAYLPCWSLVNAAGTRLYTDNAGNNTMSVFDLTNPEQPRLLQVVTLKDAGNPWDLRMDPTGRFIFVLDARDRQDLVPIGEGNELHTLVVNADGTLTEAAVSPVPIPVPLNTNPIGLAVVGH